MEITIENMSELRNKLLSEMKKGDVNYRSGYVDGALDMFNGMVKIKEEASPKIGSKIKV